MGPGLFLALAALSMGARAEREVGLEAQGVDPRAAVENRWGLDVRDELGRPVTARKVEEEMKAAAVARVARNAYASRLVKAQAVLPALELLTGLTAAIQALARLLHAPDIIPGLPGGGPKLALPVLLLLALAPLAAAFCRPSEAALPLFRSRQSRPQVLRC